MGTNEFSPQDIIPKPCHEDWFGMRGDERTRHCDLCNTEVVNLSGMSYEEIIALRAQKGGTLCGKFDNVPLSSKGHSLTKPLVIGSGIASLALASCSVDSQSPELPLLGVICPPLEQK